MALAAMVTPEGAHGYSWSINKIMVYDVYRVEVGMEHDVSGTRLALASLASRVCSTYSSGKTFSWMERFLVTHFEYLIST